MKLGVTADLHFDQLQNPVADLMAFVETIREAAFDVLLVLGDISAELSHFDLCIQALTKAAPIVGFVAGNHDLYVDERESSWRRFVNILPAIVRKYGGVWLEHDDIRVGSRAIVGSLAWYDYGLAPLYDGHRDFEGDKWKVNNDAEYIQWKYSDKEMAKELAEDMDDRLAILDKDDTVKKITVATHVPILGRQMTGKPHWSNAYWGNFQFGEAAMSWNKVDSIYSGHTHSGVSGEFVGVQYAVVPVRYGHLPQVLSHTYEEV